MSNIDIQAPGPPAQDLRPLYSYASDGSIVAAIDGASDMQAEFLLASADPTGQGLRWAEGRARPGLDWRDSEGNVLPRMPNPARAVGRVLHDLPAPCMLMVPTADFPVDEAQVEMEFDTPGPWIVRVTGRVEYLDIELELME